MTEKEFDFDEWFADRFPKYVYGKSFLEPYYSIAQIAYDKGFEDGTADAVNRLAKGTRTLC